MGSLRARNASTSLGVLWWVLDPILLGMVYFLVFGVVLQTSRGDPSFIGYLLSGMFAFYYTRSALQGGATSVIQNTKLLANVRFPRLILPISALIQALIGFLASLVVFVVLISPGIGFPGRNVLILPVVIVIHTVFNLGLGTLFARLAVPFRDINNLVPYFLRIWLYLSPIIWQLDRLDDAPDTISTLLRLNPMFDLLGLYRAALTNGPFEPSYLLTTSAWALSAVVIGIGSFVRFESKMVRYL
jgi:teichoic acid transport system permease protein